MTDQVLQNTTNLGADHLTFDGGVGDFEKKIPARKFRIKKIPALTSWGENILPSILWKKCCKIIDDLQLRKLGRNFFQDLFSQCVSLSQKFLIL